MINKDKIIIMGDATPYTTDENALRLFKDSGIEYFNLYPDEKDHYGALDRLEKAKIKSFVFGGSPINESNASYFPYHDEKFPNFTERYKTDGADLNKYKYLKGLYMIDEPGCDLYDKIKEVYIPWFNDNYSGKKIWHVNLLPSYSTFEQLCVFKSDKYSAYKEYVGRYAEEILGNVVGTKTLGVDHYPLRENGGVAVISEDWLFDLAVVGKNAKKAEAIYSVCIQAFYVDGLKRVNKDDVLFQFFVSMAFGASMFEIYAYTTMHKSEALTDDYGRPTDIYYAVKDAITEIRTLEKEYLGYSFAEVGCFSEKGCEAFDNIKEFQSEKLKGISDVVSHSDCLVSRFYCDNDKDKFAYIVVNYGVPDKTETDVNILFDDEKDVYVFKNGETTRTKTRNKRFSVRLRKGEGAFIKTAKQED